MAEEPRAVSIDELLGHAAWIRRLARTLVLDESRAEDVVQETWLATLRRPPQGGEVVRGWLRAVVRNHARLAHGDERRRRARGKKSAAPESVPLESVLLERVGLQRAVADAVAALPEPSRHVVLLRFFQDLGPREIARALATPEATERTRLRRALERPRHTLGERFGNREQWCVGLASLELLIQLVAGSSMGTRSTLRSSRMNWALETGSGAVAR